MGQSGPQELMSTLEHCWDWALLVCARKKRAGGLLENALLANTDKRDCTNGVLADTKGLA